MTDETASAEPTYVGAEGNFGRPDLNALVGGMEQRIDVDSTKPNEEVKVPEEAEQQMSEERPEEQPEKADFSKQVEAEREKFLEKQKMKQMEEKIAELEARASEKKGPTTEDYDAIIDKIINGEDQGAEEKEAAKSLTQEDVDRMVQERLEAKLQERDQAREGEQAISEFKASINNELTKSPESYRHINAMGEMDLVYNVIEQDYTQNAEKYGPEWAQQNIMTIESAAQKVEKHLASEFKRVLESEYMKPILHEIMGTMGQQSPQVQSNTLTNDVTTVSGTQVDETKLTDEQRFKLALESIN